MYYYIGTRTEIRAPPPGPGANNMLIIWTFVATAREMTSIQSGRRESLMHMQAS